MRRLVMIGAAGLAVVLVAALVGCGPSRPTGSDYLGKWEGTIEALTGSEGPCHLDISKVGESFVIKSERQTIGNCVFYEGIATLTPEGNLKRGSGLSEMIISFDKNKNQAVVSGGGKLRYLTKANTPVPSPETAPVGVTAVSPEPAAAASSSSKIEAQQRKPATPIEGTISKFECGDNCYLTITDKNGKEYTGLCLASICNAWTALQTMPPGYRGRSVRATLGKGKQYDEAGDVMGTMDAFTRIQML